MVEFDKCSLKERKKEKGRKGGWIKFWGLNNALLAPWSCLNPFLAGLNWTTFLLWLSQPPFRSLSLDYPRYLTKRDFFRDPSRRRIMPLCWMMANILLSSHWCWVEKNRRKRSRRRSEKKTEENCPENLKKGRIEKPKLRKELVSWEIRKVVWRCLKRRLLGNYLWCWLQQRQIHFISRDMRV